MAGGDVYSALASVHLAAQGMQDQTVTCREGSWRSQERASERYRGLFMFIRRPAARRTI
jgi:hypothetical protein